MESEFDLPEVAPEKLSLYLTQIRPEIEAKIGEAHVSK